MKPKIYVVSTGNQRHVVTSQTRLKTDDVLKRAEKLWRKANPVALGAIVEVVSIDDGPDDDNTNYLSTEDFLKRIGRWSEKGAK